MKDKCTKCGSENISVCKLTGIDEETNAEFVNDDLKDAHCKDCGWDFIIVEL